MTNIPPQLELALERIAEKAAEKATAKSRRYIDEQLAESRRHLDELTTESRRHLDEQRAESDRHLEQLLEHTDANMELVTEGYSLLNQRLDRVVAVVEKHSEQFEVVNTHLAVLRDKVTGLETGQSELRQDLAEFRTEVSNEFKEVRAQIHLSYTELDGRLRTLEHEVGDLQGRVAALESHIVS